jgi:dihydrofolate reductase
MRDNSTVTLVAAVARNGVIGNGPDIPWHLPGEQRLFKELTTGHVLVMGRKTYDSIGRPLPGRTTVVVTRHADWQPVGGRPESVLVAGSVDEALTLAAAVDDQVFVVGGGEIYRAAMSLADRLVITWVDLEPEGDAYFPTVDETEWTGVEQEHHDAWSVVHYERSAQKAKKV